MSASRTKKAAKDLTLTKAASRLLAKTLLPDLRQRAKLPSIEAALKARYEREKAASRTGEKFGAWVEQTIEQVGAAWILSCVFLRTLEDRGYVEHHRIAGPGATDSQQLFFELAPSLTERDYLLMAFRELSLLPGAEDLMGPRHNPAWRLGPSAEAARAVLEFFRETCEDGNLRWTFAAPVGASVAGSNTRFLGDLYQDLSESVRERYALLQTPHFVESFILDQTLEPAIKEFGLEEVRVIDPTCGSGHFLLGALDRLFEHRMRAKPGLEPREHAIAALKQVYGVDINPYAVEIARFRLMLAFLERAGIVKLSRAPRIEANLVAADSLLHGARNVTKQLSERASDPRAWGDDVFVLDDEVGARRILDQGYHAVVGNPPYITEKDPKKREKYRELYKSAAGKYALAAPCTEQFFGLGIDGGFVGLINSNAWTKRDYGQTLVTKVLPSLDLQKVVDVSGCYIPGNGTPSLILLGRNRPPPTEDVVAVLGKRGEQEQPLEPESAPVWREITSHHSDLGFEGKHVSVESVARSELSSHPWVLAGGGARAVFRLLETHTGVKLSTVASSIGFMSITGEDDAYSRPTDAWLRSGVAREWLRGFGIGANLRDWELACPDRVLFPYRDAKLVDETNSFLRQLWPLRRILQNRPDFSGKKYIDVGRPWYEYHQIPLDRLREPLSLAFAFVATHNHFVFDRGGRVFNRSAPIIKLKAGTDEKDFQGLLGHLNSSTAAFWCRLVMFPKGGDQIGDGARLSTTPWQDRLEYAGNLLQQLPVPDLGRLRETLHDLVVAAEDTVRRMGEVAPEKSLAAALDSKPKPSLASLHAVRDQIVAERARLRGILISLQEEMDWRVYGLFGVPTVTAKSLEEVSVPVAPEHRPMEVRLAREVETDISASEWFRLHARPPPADVGGPLADLYRRRLALLDDPVRGKELRLLETPETKRRWPPSDDAKAFLGAARSWLLDRVEQVFRDQLQPQILTARQLALEVGRDPSVNAVHELLSENSGDDLVRLLGELLDAEGVPHLVALRYTETGVEVRKSWELCWDLQRADDAGKLEAALKVAGLESIPVPDKYGNDDFQRHYAILRGSLDVPKERFVTVPGGNSDDDPTTLAGWAGWDHLQRAQALAGLYQQRKTQDGWGKERLSPLLAGLLELVPWLKQWHNEPCKDFGGERLGVYYERFVEAEAHAFGLTLDDLRAWRLVKVAGKRKAAGKKKASAEPADE